MDFFAAKKKLQEIDQQQLLLHWPTLNKKESDRLLDQIDQLDVALLRHQQEALKVHSCGSLAEALLQPIPHYEQRGNRDDYRLGKELIAQGKVGALILAGGQGSRLGFPHPKGCYPISVIRKKSLFQLIAEKTLAAGKEAQRPLPVAILCGAHNHRAIEQFFSSHDFFGLKPTQLFFFAQQELPLLNANGDLFLSAPAEICRGSEGNGTAFYHFVAAKIAEQWQKMGIECVALTLIDNPLADPFDAELIGFQRRTGYSAIVKGIERTDPEESLGLLALHRGRLSVVEYTELPEKMRRQRVGNFLLFRLANLSLFCFDMQAIVRLAMHTHKLPLHVALKLTEKLNAEGQVERSVAWKCERYLFDLLAWADKTGLLVYPREECFAPLKNSSGPYGPEGVQRALLAADRRVITKITGLAPPSFPFELAQDFYYPTEALLARWCGRSISSSGYIQAS